jgi:hypothetical protein
MNPFFPLKKTPVQTINGETIKGKYALQHPNGHVFSVVSERYKPVTNLEVDSMFNNLMGFMNVDYQTPQNHLDITGKKWRQWRILKGFDFSIATKDVVGIMVEIFNGYDGLTGIGFRILGFRHLCTNGMITGKSLMMEHSFKHILKDLEPLAEAFQNKFGLFDKNTQIWKSWQEIPFSQSMFTELVVNAEYLGERLQKHLIEYYPIGISKYGMKETMWGAFNVITDYMTHYTKARGGSNIFTNATKQLTKLASEFYKLDASPKVPLLSY